MTVSVEAALDEGTLYLTPRALDEPVLIAAAIYTEPRRGAALMRWLATDLRGELEKRGPGTAGPSTADDVVPSERWVSRIKQAL